MQHAIRKWNLSGNAWFADPTAIRYHTLSVCKKVWGFTHLERFFYIACPKPEAQFEIVS